MNTALALSTWARNSESDEPNSSASTGFTAASLGCAAGGRAGSGGVSERLAGSRMHAVTAMSRMSVRIPSVRASIVETALAVERILLIDGVAVGGQEARIERGVVGVLGILPRDRAGAPRVALCDLGRGER